METGAFAWPWGRSRPMPSFTFSGGTDTNLYTGLGSANLLP